MTSEEELDGLVADLDEAEVIDVIDDAMGDKVRVGRLRGAVLVGVQGSPGILDTPGLRDRFARAWMEACRRADGEQPVAEGQAQARPVTFDMTDDELYFVLSEALEEWAALQRGRATADGGNEQRERWANLADDARAKAKEAFFREAT